MLNSNDNDKQGVKQNNEMMKIKAPSWNERIWLTWRGKFDEEFHCPIILWHVTGEVIYFYYISHDRVEDSHDRAIKSEDNILIHHEG